MISHLRATLRLLLLKLFLLGWVTVHLVGRLFTWTRSSRLRWRRFYLRRACRVVLALLGIRVHVHGDPPAGGGILVTNHLGYVDILVLASFQDAVFVSRSDVRDWPLLGPMVSMAGTIYLDRSRGRDLSQALRRMRAELEDDAMVVFFPEGTSSDGRRLLPFKPSLFQGATEVGASVFAAALGYRVASGAPPAETAVAWWEDDADFAPHLWRLLGLPRVDATVVFADEVHRAADLDRKELCRRAEATVRRALERRWELESGESRR